MEVLILKIEDVVDVVFSGGTPSTKKTEFWNGDLNWLSSGETRNSRIFETQKTITKIGVDSSSTKLARIGDTVIASAGQGHTRGQSSLLMIDTYINQSLIAVRPDSTKVNPRFLHYFIRDSYDQLRRISDGHSSRGSLTTAMIKQLEIPDISRSDQNKVDYFLTPMEDLFYSLQEESDLLIELVKSIYKSLFVKFDPVRYSLQKDSNYPLPKKITQLFPHDFEHSELGLIPSGWKVGNILQECSVLTGGTPKTKVKEYWGEEIPWASGKDISGPPIFINSTERMITSEGVENSSTRILPIGTTMVTARGTVGQMKITARPMAMSQTSFGFKSKGIWSDGHVFLALNQIIQQLHQMAYGAVFDTFTQQTVKDTKIVIPPKNISEEFGKLVEPMFQKVKLNMEKRQQIRNIFNYCRKKIMQNKLPASKLGG